MEEPLAPPEPKVLFTSARRGWEGLDAAFVQVPRGKSEAPGREDHVLGMHFGRPVKADCSVGDTRVRGLQKPGDIVFVPAGIPGSWEDDGECRILRLSLRSSLIRQVAEDAGRDHDTIRFTPQSRLRDPGLEAVLCAIKSDLVSPAPSDPLYVDHLVHALVLRLIDVATEGRPASEARPAGLGPRQLATLTEFIEANLDRKLHLVDLAAAIGVSVTRLKILFRNSTGSSVHQYVIRRRSELAQSLIATTTLPASEIALAAGFAHQSHMTSTMRRILGLTPSDIDRPRNAI
jgi:AraC family transcriptional regulator